MRAEGSKVALVTGSARGIGLATAKRVLGEGWRVGLLDQDREGLERAVSEVARPDAARALVCDVANPTEVIAALDAVAEAFGRLDALVNNAAIAIFKPLLETSYEDWTRVLAVNLTGPFLCTQAAARLLGEAGAGSIVNVTSISGLRASTLRVAYGTSKAGLAHLTKQQAVELAGLGIRVNAVAPGPVDTAMAKAVHSLRRSAPTTTPRSPSIGMVSRRRSPTRSSSFPAIGRATSPVRRSRSTEVSRRPASACRRCAVKGGVGPKCCSPRLYGRASARAGAARNKGPHQP